MSDKDYLIAESAIKFISEELFLLRTAPKFNGCEMKPEWKEQIEIFEYLQELVEKEGLSNDRCRD